MYYSLHPHAKTAAESKGFSFEAVLEAANNPTITYSNGRYPGQYRHIRGGIVAVVDPATSTIITVYENVTETGVRVDQIDRAARRYAASQEDTLCLA